MSKQIDKFIRQEIARIAEMPVKDVAEVPKSSKVDIQKDHHSMVKYC